MLMRRLGAGGIYSEHIVAGLEIHLASQQSEQATCFGPNAAAPVALIVHPVDFDKRKS